MAFESAARFESFSSAADELCLTTGAVSRHIRTLENKLGVLLFIRGHKRVQLTEAGRGFAVTCQKIIQELSAAETSIKRCSGLKTLTVNCLPTFAMYWLIPRLPDFYQKYPDIRINVITGTGVADPKASFDIVIRRDPSHFSGLRTVPFLSEDSVIVCSRNYFLRPHAGEAPLLTGHTLIHIRVREDLWRTWGEQHQISTENVLNHLHLDHTYAAIQAAEDGLGIALIPRIFCEKHLASGRLVIPWYKVATKTGTYSVTLPEKGNTEASCFIEWIIMQAEIQR